VVHDLARVYGVEPGDLREGRPRISFFAKALVAGALVAGALIVFG
jgi:hypothetical protein